MRVTVYFSLSFLALLILGIAIWPLIYVGDKRGGSKTNATFIGTTSCKGCHSNQFEKWRQSDHAHSMEIATNETILAPFKNEKQTIGEQTFEFYKKLGKFNLKVIDNAGEHSFPIPFTIGYKPLQMYLVDVGNGRLQALPIAWDARKKRDGGSKWFDLYPDMGAGFHWQSPIHTWNSRCASCHSTDLTKIFSLVKQKYETTFKDPNVTCEACHGPASNHILWSKGENSIPNKGFARSLKSHTNWVRINNKPIAIQTDRTSDDQQLEVCAPCHSRRVQFRSNHDHSKSFHDQYDLTLLEEGLYHPDGQIDDEVFVYGSFLQSKMHGKGVVCSDCHDPHQGKPYFSDNRLCTRCHDAGEFESNLHHQHNAKGEGGQCVNCHMPEKIYMAVDPRRDHKFVIPRPDLSIKFDTPNPCTNCHQDWSKEKLSENFKALWPKLKGQDNLTELVFRARQGDPKSWKTLASEVKRLDIAPIKKATMLSLLPAREYLNIHLEMLSNENPLVRKSALINIGQYNLPQEILEKIAPVLQDPNAPIRAEAGRILKANKYQPTSEAEKEAFKVALNEYIEVQHLHSDTAASHLNLALLAISEGNYQVAMVHYQDGLRVDPYNVELRVNLADLYRFKSKEKRAKIELDKALNLSPKHLVVNYAMGLWHVRQKDYQGAIPFLKKASDHENSSQQIILTYALALEKVGSIDLAKTELKRGLRKYKWSKQIENLLDKLVAVKKSR